MKKNKTIIFLSVFLTIISLTMFINADEPKKIRVAVLKFSAKGNIEDSLAEAVTENLITSLIDSGYFEVIERNQIDKVLKELNLQNSDDFDDNLRVQLGKLYGVELVIIGSVAKIGDTITINVRGVEVKTGVARFAKNLMTTSENNIPYLIPLLVDIITGKKIDESQINKDKVTIMSDSKIRKDSVEDITKEKVLIFERTTHFGWESKDIIIDFVSGIKNKKFSKIIIEATKNCIEFDRVTINFNDLEPEIRISENFTLSANDENIKKIDTLSKDGKPRNASVISIRYKNIDCDNDQKATLKIYGIY